MGLFSKADEPNIGEASVEPSYIPPTLEDMARGNRPKRRIKRKYVEVVELEGTGEIPVARGKRVVEAKIIIDRVNESKLSGLPRTPDYKTVVIFECVEFEDD